jgi:hypothetical protein
MEQEMSGWKVQKRRKKRDVGAVAEVAVAAEIAVADCMFSKGTRWDGREEWTT